MNAVPKFAGNDRARVLPVTLDQYFKDPCVTPSLSQSLAHTLVTRSPLHAWTEHPRLGNCRAESTKYQNEGSLIHSLLLGKGAEVDVIDAKDFRTKVAQEARDASIAAGRLPVIKERYEEVLVAAEALRKSIAAYGITLGGESELPIEWREQGFDGDVLCRGLFDNLARGYSLDPAQHDHTLFDLKKISSAEIRTCSKHVYEYGYDIQRAAYTSGSSKLLDAPPERIDFVILFMEIEPPYAVVPARLDDTLIRIGESRWQRACSLWERCLASNRWPSYTESITTLEAPPWAITQEDMTHARL